MKNDIQESLRKSMIATDELQKYDKQAKKLLSSKAILAFIVKNLIPEYAELSVAGITSLIEGDVHVDSIPVDPGLTNHPGAGDYGNIRGLNTEQSEINEGVVFFDILFHILTPDLKSRLLINIELQKDDPAGYEVEDRSDFYLCRLISSEKDREFFHSDYSAIVPVYSIWICTNSAEDSIAERNMNSNLVFGKMPLKPVRSKLNAIIIRMSDSEQKSNDNELIRFLWLIFSDRLKLEEKFNIIEKEYHISLTSQLKGELIHMESIGMGLVDRTLKKADRYYTEKIEKIIEEKEQMLAQIEREKKAQLTQIEYQKNEQNKHSVLMLAKAGNKPEFIADVLQMTVEQVIEILNQQNPES